MSNPFFHGNPVAADQFLDRRRELRRIVGRILNQGQSTAIVGEPRTGKTSILEYLVAPETQAELYGVDAERLLFAYLDAQTLGGQFSQAANLAVGSGGQEVATSDTLNRELAGQIAFAQRRFDGAADDAGSSLSGLWLAIPLLAALLAGLALYGVSLRLREYR